MRAGCTFFYFKSDNFIHKSNIPITQVLEIVWLFLFSQSTVRDAAAATGHSLHTIVNWWKMCRLICTLTMDKQPKFRGTSDAPIQIDESFFSGRRKYNSGRLQKGDKRRKCAQKEDGNDEDEFEEWVSMHDGTIYNDDSEAWLWVIGMYQSKEHVRSIRVQNRTQETVKLVLNKFVEIGSHVWTDSLKS